jgi:hypothetical protein
MGHSTREHEYLSARHICPVSKRLDRIGGSDISQINMLEAEEGDKSPWELFTCNGYLLI